MKSCPDYTIAMRGETGGLNATLVTLRFTVDAQGIVDPNGIVVIPSQPHFSASPEEIDLAADIAVGCRFAPAEESGVRIAAETTRRFRVPRTR